MVRPPTNTSRTVSPSSLADTYKREGRPISTPCSNTTSRPLATAPWPTSHAIAQPRSRSRRRVFAAVELHPVVKVRTRAAVRGRPRKRRTAPPQPSARAAPAPAESQVSQAPPATGTAPSQTAFPWKPSAPAASYPAPQPARPAPRPLRQRRTSRQTSGLPGAWSQTRPAHLSQRRTAPAPPPAFSFSRTVSCPRTPAWCQ